MTTGGQPVPSNDAAANAFGDVLSTVELASVVMRIKWFDPTLFANPTQHVFNAGPTRPQNRERGDELWTKSGCATCHGARGKDR